MPNETYFLGASAPNGFFTPIKELLADTSNTVYILKGTPGCGKSTLMKKISEAFCDAPQEIFLCSSDPDSLDAVYLKDKRAVIIDGTPPHCLEPEYPLAVETIVDLGAYIETGGIKAERERIISLTDKYRSCRRSCRLCLCAVSSVCSDMISAAKELLDAEKLDRFANRAAKRILPAKSAEKGKRASRQLSAITSGGYSTLVPAGYDIFILADDRAAAADIFLRRLADAAEAKGLAVMISECTVCAERFYEHILLPNERLAFMTSSCINRLRSDSPKKVIRFDRFYKKEMLSADKQLSHRLRFDKKAVKELLDETALKMADAAAVHNEIEEIYTRSADKSSLNRLTYKLISEIKSL